MAHTPAELKTLQESQPILQNLKSMVIEQNGTESILFTEPPNIVPFSFGDHPVNQGESVQLMCAINKGDRPLSITWSLKGDIINSDPTLTTTMIGQQTSLLMISSVDYTHIGEYTCRAENPAGISKYSAELKVNGKKAEALKIIYCRDSCHCPLLLWN